MLLNCMLKRSCGHIWRCCCEKRNAAEGDYKEYYYDIFILTRLQAGNIDIGILQEAFRATAERRGSMEIIRRYREIMQVVRNSEIMNKRWHDYRKDFDYAAGIGFDEVCEAIIETMDMIHKTGFR